MNYFKSFEQHGPEHELTSYNPHTKKRFTSQTLTGALAEKVIYPNTTHTYLPPRLCVSRPTQEYLGSYRPEGMIFETEQQPLLSTPFDLMAITTGKTFTSQDYNAKFLEGSEQFVFSNVEDMLRVHPTAETALQTLNTFREQHGLPAVDLETMQYNECCFFEEVHIQPLALIGTSEDITSLARTYNLPVYANIKEYLR